MESEKLRSELSEKGRNQEKKYSWEKVAEQTLEVYKSVV
jgi:glycosyltransferase involved in cell wall biosynthesis